MKSKLTKYGLMTIAAVLLVAVAFAGAASATEITSLDDYKTKFVNCATVSDGTYYIKGNWDIPSSHNQSDTLTIGSGKVVLDFTNFTGGFAGIPDETLSEQNGGLFGNVSLGSNTLEIVGLNMTSVNVTANGDYIGGIIGNVADSGTLNFTDCHLVNCSITGNNGVGGLVGRASSANVNVKDCSVKHCDVVSGSRNVGGLVGYADSVSFVRGNVTNSTVALSASSGSINVGGLVGSASSASGIEGCMVTNSTVALSVSSESYNVGGLVGITGPASGIEGCMVKNCVIASSSINVGGLFGSASPASGIGNCTVKNCTITGSAHVGGLFGSAGSGATGSQTNDVLYSAVTTGSTSVFGNECGAIGNQSTGSIMSSNIVFSQASYPDYDPASGSDFWKIVRWGGNGTYPSYTMFTNLSIYGKVGGYGVGSATYAVTYNGNGADGGLAPVDSNKYEGGSQVTVEEKGTLVKTGYVFSGWNVGSRSGELKQAGETFTIAKDTTLYAQWTYGITITNATGTFPLTSALTTVCGDYGTADNGTAVLTNESGKLVLTLNGFKASNMSGVPIIDTAHVDVLKIVLNGESNLTGSFGDMKGGLLTVNGNLTIEGGSSSKLLVDNTNSSLYGVGSILVTDNLMINDAKVTAIANNTNSTSQTEGEAAIMSGENITITGSNAVVDAKITSASPNDGLAVSILAYNNMQIDSSAKVTGKAQGQTDSYALYSFVGNVSIGSSAVVEANATSSAGNASAIITSVKDIIIESGAQVTANASAYRNAFAINSEKSNVSITGANTVVRANATSSYTAISIFAEGKLAIDAGADVSAVAHNTGSKAALSLSGSNIEIAGTETVVFAEAESNVLSAIAIFGNNITVTSVRKLTAMGSGDPFYPSSFGYNVSGTGCLDMTGLAGYAFSNATVSGAEPKSYATFIASDKWHAVDVGILSNYTAVTIEKVDTPSPYTPSSSSKQSGSTVILSEGQTAPTAYATATPTVAPTVKPTEKPATPTVIATAAPTTQPTETQKSPAPFVGILAGLGAVAVLLRMRK